jgi:putative sterol carrier protein
MADEPTTAGEPEAPDAADAAATARYPFLSEEWTTAAKAIEAAGGEDPAAGVTTPAQSIRMNLVVTDVPFGEANVEAHLDTSSGQIKLDLGHLDTPELKVTLDYSTAKAILVDGNFQAGMQAFMAGKVKVEGDMTKLLQLQAGPADPRAAELAAKIKAITAD